jgi:hypothetical protein
VQSPNTGPCLEVRQCASSLSLYLLKELWWTALLYCITFTKHEHKMAKSRDWQRVWSQYHMHLVLIVCPSIILC